MKIGVGFRKEIASWIEANSHDIDCLEITAEHFYSNGEATLQRLASRFPLFVHGLGLSLGTPGPLDEWRLEAFDRVVSIAQPEWVSEHIAFTRAGRIDLGHLNPIPPTRESVRILADHAREVSERCKRPILLENITSHIRLDGELSETEFLNEVCERAGCGLLLDVTNLYINSRNHRFDPISWLEALEPSLITQLHIVGYSKLGDRYADSHSAAIQSDLLELAKEVVRRAPVSAVILERDEDFPSSEGLQEELEKLKRLRANTCVA